MRDNDEPGVRESGPSDSEELNFLGACLRPVISNAQMWI
jgi:hypothetical protein